MTTPNVQEVTVAVEVTGIKYVPVELDTMLALLPRGYSRDRDGVMMWLLHSQGQYPANLGLPHSFGDTTPVTVSTSTKITR